MSVANPQSLFGGPELILVAAIVLLLAVAPFLFERGRGRQWTDTAWSRGYLDRLFGPARPPVPGAGLPGTIAQAIRPMVAIRGQVLR